jgi:quinol monooxygenase YgiN
MPIFETGGYRVKPEAVGRVRKAIGDFLPFIRENEPGTEMYLAWQEKEDPTRFLHLFIFKDEGARTRHGESKAVRDFEAVYSPDLVGGGVVFTDYEMVAGKRDAFSGSESAERLTAFYEAVVARDLERARDYLAPDLVFEGLFETYRSADHYLETLGGLLGITVRLDVKQILGQGDEAAVFFELETKAPAEGRVLVAEWHRFRGGKIVHVRSAFDGRPYAALFGGSRR